MKSFEALVGPLQAALWPFRAGIFLLLVWTGGCDQAPTSFYNRVSTSERPQFISHADAMPGGDAQAEHEQWFDQAEQQGGIRWQDPVDEIPETFTSTELKPESTSTLEWTFKTSEVIDVVTQISADQALDESRLSMTGTTSEEYLSFSQVSRPQYTENFQQGMQDQVEEEWIQEEDQGGIVDIMLVMDNSGSMLEEQQNMSNKLDPLLTFISKSDWRIAINTTDPSGGCMRALIQKGEQDITSRFASAVIPGTNGSGNERGILQAVRGLQADCIQGPWVRPNSTIAVLIVSDEDNCSLEGMHCNNQAYNHEAYLLDYLESIRNLGTSARVYGIVSHPSQPCQTAYNTGFQYSRAVAASQGTWGDICDSDYSQTLADISANMASILKSQFSLKYQPDPQTLQVFMNGVEQWQGWSITGTTLEFDQAPAAGTEIRLVYTHSSAHFDRLQLTNIPDPASLEVLVADQPISSSDYTIASNTIIFDSAPEAGVSIRIQYRSGTPLITAFDLPPQTIASNARVSINYQLQDPQTYTLDASPPRLVFAEAPADGALIEIDFHTLSHAILSYPWQGNEAPSRVIDLADLRDLSFSWDGQYIHFPPSEFRYMRRLAVLTPSQNLGQGYLKLPARPIGAYVEVRSEEMLLCSTKQELALDEMVLDLGSCPLAALDEFELHYSILGPVRQNYSLPSALKLKEGQIQILRLWHGSVQVEDYRIENETIFVQSNLSQEGDLKLEVEIFERL